MAPAVEPKHYHFEIFKTYTLQSAMSKKRLLIFHPTIAPYRIDFFNDLNRAFDMRVCLQYWNLRDQTFDYNKIYSQFTFKPHYLKEVLRIGRKSFWGGFAKHIEAFNPDIVMVSEFDLFTIMIMLYGYIKRKRYKVVSICDDSYNMVAENNDFSIIHKWLRKWVVPHFDEMILVEPKVTEWYRAHCGVGYCFPIIKPDDKARADYERILPLSRNIAHEHGLTGKRVVLFVGRLVELKNVGTAIRAFSRLNQDENVMVIVGDGPERQKLKRIAAELHTNTLFTGRLEGDELNAWYNIATIFVLPSHTESFGAVTNEALLAGCYALISKNAGSASLIEEGVNGFTFPPMDVDEQSKKMEQLAEKAGRVGDIVLKPNLMPEGYEEKMQQLILHLNSL